MTPTSDLNNILARNFIPKEKVLELLEKNIAIKTCNPHAYPWSIKIRDSSGNIIGSEYVFKFGGYYLIKDKFNGVYNEKDSLIHYYSIKTIDNIVDRQEAGVDHLLIRSKTPMRTSHIPEFLLINDKFLYKHYYSGYYPTKESIQEYNSDQFVQFSNLSLSDQEESEEISSEDFF